jgi:hypothetical protein
MTPAAQAEAIRALRAEIEELKADVKADRIDTRKELRGLRDFQLWVTGGLSAAAFFGGLFAAKIKAVFGI